MGLIKPNKVCKAVAFQILQVGSLICPSRPGPSSDCYVARFWIPFALCCPMWCARHRLSSFCALGSLFVLPFVMADAVEAVTSLAHEAAARVAVFREKWALFDGLAGRAWKCCRSPRPVHPVDRLWCRSVSVAAEHSFTSVRTVGDVQGVGRRPHSPNCVSTGPTVYGRSGRGQHGHHGALWFPDNMA